MAMSTPLVVGTNIIDGDLTITGNLIIPTGKEKIGASPASTHALNVDAATYAHKILSVTDPSLGKTQTLGMRSDGQGMTFASTTNNTTISIFRNQIAGATTTGALEFEALNSAGASWAPGLLTADVLDDTASSEDSMVYLSLYVAGVLNYMSFQPAATINWRSYRPGIGNLNANWEAIQCGYNGTTAFLTSNASGTGTRRDFQLGHAAAPWTFTATEVYPSGTDNTLNIGTTSQRVATGYFGTRVVIGNTTSNQGYLCVRAQSGGAMTIVDTGANVIVGTNVAANLIVAGGGTVPGGAALSTSATVGYLMLSASAGAQTGTPASIPTGSVPVAIDSTNKKIGLYIGGSWVWTAALT